MRKIKQYQNVNELARDLQFFSTEGLLEEDYYFLNKIPSNSKIFLTERGVYVKTRDVDHFYSRVSSGVQILIDRS